MHNTDKVCAIFAVGILSLFILLHLPESFPISLSASELHGTVPGIVLLCLSFVGTLVGIYGFSALRGWFRLTGFVSGIFGALDVGVLLAGYGRY